MEPTSSVIFRYDLHFDLWKYYIPVHKNKSTAIICMMRDYTNNKRSLEDTRQIIKAIQHNNCFACYYAEKIKKMLNSHESKCYHCPFDIQNPDNFCLDGLLVEYLELASILSIHENMENIAYSTVRNRLTAKYAELLTWVGEDEDEDINASSIVEDFGGRIRQVADEAKNICDRIAYFPVKKGVTYVDLNGKVKVKK